ncbi:glyoxylase-like metal-dependent hydrolase (beta-lactamase superfamily II) [Crossiella equi]|uniref:Glyoxylase-like metal-dependent hydrolase (Beta-lactamase superfamily II) n=1 Tax=Crossiella equi TaxID=130796 RepID=A0ABS5AQ13_9PSEU|nr:MBL fold metallo-hydrolase [Crossiella equi]MBP2478653.1 glyoxylase-like metal-dependent hydrolase (beta-lactamase superfamily II) [Crossiella equi]
MKVHHLNCGTMDMRQPLVCHVLLLEAPTGLVLVDTGYGLKDIESPATRLGPTRHITKPVLRQHETAIRQVEALGHKASDVRHILLTHLDFDHAGGLADFPDAEIHTTATEWQAASNPRTAAERSRYHQSHWSHTTNITTHTPTGEPWFGFPAAKPLDHLAPGLVMIPLPGHTRGHTGYAINQDDTWLFHTGDAFYDHRALTRTTWQGRLSRTVENLLAADRTLMRANRARLAELRDNPAIRMFSAHDPLMLTNARGAAASS